MLQEPQRAEIRLVMLVPGERTAESAGSSPETACYATARGTFLFSVR